MNDITRQQVIVLLARLGKAINPKFKATKFLRDCK
jgi:hypothetical protein